MIGPSLILIAAMLWGFDGILRRSLFTLPPITIVFYEHLIGAILIAPFLFASLNRERLTSKEWRALGGIAVFSGVLGTLLFTAALLKVTLIPFSVVFLIQKLQPIFTIGAGALVLGERITRPFGTWASVALVASYFVTFPKGIPNTGEGGAYIIAALYAFLAAACWGSSTALSRYVLLNHSNTLITGLRFWMTVPIALIFVAALGATASLATITKTQLLALLIISCSTGMVALWMYYRGLKTTRAGISAIVELAFPVTAVAIDCFLYGTVLAFSQYIAAVVLFFAMYKVARLNSGNLDESLSA